MIVVAGMGAANTPIAIEPGLFEWLAWYPDGVPDWLTLDELTAAGFCVRTDYEPVIKTKDLQELPVAANGKRETVEQFYNRSHFLTQTLLKNTEPSGE